MIHLKINTKILFSLLLSISLLVNCKAIAPSIVSNDISYNSETIEDFTQDLFAIIFKEQESLFKKYVVTPDIVRLLAPESTNEKTDAQIESEMILNQTNKFLNDCKLVRLDLKENGYNPDKTNFLGYKTFPEDSQGEIHILSIEIEIKGKRGSVPITYYVKEGKFFAFELLNSSNVVK